MSISLIITVSLAFLCIITRQAHTHTRTHTLLMEVLFICYIYCCCLVSHLLLLLLLLYCCAFNHCRCCCCMNENVCKQKSGVSIHAFAFILLIRFVVLRWIAFVMFCCLSKHSFQCVFLFLCKKKWTKQIRNVCPLPSVYQAMRHRVAKFFAIRLIV